MPRTTWKWSVSCFRFTPGQTFVTIEIGRDPAGASSMAFVMLTICSMVSGGRGVSLDTALPPNIISAGSDVTPGSRTSHCPCSPTRAISKISSSCARLTPMKTCEILPMGTVPPASWRSAVICWTASAPSGGGGSAGSATAPMAPAMPGLAAGLAPANAGAPHPTTRGRRGASGAAEPLKGRLVGLSLISGAKGLGGGGALPSGAGSILFVPAKVKPPFPGGADSGRACGAGCVNRSGSRGRGSPSGSCFMTAFTGSGCPSASSSRTSHWSPARSNPKWPSSCCRLTNLNLEDTLPSEAEPPCSSKSSVTCASVSSSRGGSSTISPSGASGGGGGSPE
mmetsp:Transcript_15044/g.43018  ORF Transcript_15044/g.43018 Transcript_15044/m.43018 type:complete len:338 (+) Transcript_15044:350-1363(+)